jgi:hypothetical protein
LATALALSRLLDGTGHERNPVSQVGLVTLDHLYARSSRELGHFFFWQQKRRHPSSHEDFSRFFMPSLWILWTLVDFLGNFLNMFYAMFFEFTIDFMG